MRPASLRVLPALEYIKPSIRSILAYRHASAAFDARCAKERKGKSQVELRVADRQRFRKHSWISQDAREPLVGDGDTGAHAAELHRPKPVGNHVCEFNRQI